MKVWKRASGSLFQSLYPKMGIGSVVCLVWINLTFSNWEYILQLFYLSCHWCLAKIEIPHTLASCTYTHGNVRQSREVVPCFCPPQPAQRHYMLQNCTVFPCHCFGVVGTFGISSDPYMRDPPLPEHHHLWEHRMLCTLRESTTQRQGGGMLQPAVRRQAPTQADVAS